MCCVVAGKGVGFGEVLLHGCGCRGAQHHPHIAGALPASAPVPTSSMHQRWPPAGCVVRVIGPLCLVANWDGAWVACRHVVW